MTILESEAIFSLQYFFFFFGGGGRERTRVKWFILNIPAISKSGHFSKCTSLVHSAWQPALGVSSFEKQYVASERFVFKKQMFGWHLHYSSVITHLYLMTYTEGEKQESGFKMYTQGLKLRVRKGQHTQQILMTLLKTCVWYCWNRHYDSAQNIFPTPRKKTSPLPELNTHR